MTLLFILTTVVTMIISLLKAGLLMLLGNGLLKADDLRAFLGLASQTAVPEE